MTHPTFEIEDDDGDLRIRFSVPQSRFVPVEIVLSIDEVDMLVASLWEARSFAGATAGDAD